MSRVLNKMQPFAAGSCQTQRTEQEDRVSEPVTEAELIQRVLAGDAAAERGLYDLHVDRVYRLAYRLAGADPDLAQDFTQEAFLRAFDRLADFKGRSAFRPGCTRSPCPCR